MVFMETVTVYSENQTKSVNAFCERKFLNAKAGGTYNYQCPFKELNSLPVNHHSVLLHLNR
jgi:hypothetical protein